MRHCASVFAWRPAWRLERQLVGRLARLACVPGLRGSFAGLACAEALWADWYPLWEMDTNRRVAWMDEASFVSSFVFGFGTDHLRCENVHFRIHFLNWIRNLPYICMKAPIPYPFSKLDTKMDIQGRFEAISVSTFKNGYGNARTQRAPGKKRTPIRTRGRRRGVGGRHRRQKGTPGTMGSL